MTTNLLALITTLLTTNVTETFTRLEYVPFPPDLYATQSLPVYMPGEVLNHKRPTEKLVNTTISKITLITFEWPAGVPRTNEIVEPLTTRSELFETTTVWKPVALSAGNTNGTWISSGLQLIKPTPTIWSTNFSIVP